MVVNRARLSPALQTVPQFLIRGEQHIAALTPDFSTFSGRPGLLAGVNFALAKPGDTVAIYALGCGATNPPTQAGTIAAQASAVSVQRGRSECCGGDQAIALVVDGVANAQNRFIAIGQ